MSFLLTRIRRALAGQEPLTGAVMVAINAHWKGLIESDASMPAAMHKRIKDLQAACKTVLDAEEQRTATELALWEAKRAAFDVESTLGGPPGKPGVLDSGDWGTHWILFYWSEPEEGGAPWGYRLERSADGVEFYPAEMTIDTEVTLLNQPQNQKLRYRVIAFNGWGDGPPSALFEIKFDPALVDHSRR